MPEDERVSQDGALDFREIWGVVLRGKWYVLASFILIVGFTAFFTFTADEVYRSEAKIMLEPAGVSGSTLSSILESQMFSESKQVSLENKIQILTSTPVIEMAVEGLRENENYLELRRKEITRNTPLQNFLSLIGLGQTTETPDPNSLVSVGQLKSNLNVSKVSNTDILRISVTGGSPKSVQIATDALLNAFKEKEINTARKDLSEVKSFLEKQREKTKNKLENFETSSIQFQNKSGMILGQSGAESKLSQLEAMMVNARVNYRDKQDELEAIDKMLDSVKEDLFAKDLIEGGQAVINEFQDKYFQLKKLKNDMEELEQERTKYLEQENYIKAEQLANQIKNMKEKYTSEATQKFEILELLPKYEDLIKRQLNAKMEVEAAKNRVQVIEEKINSEMDKISQNSLQLLRYNRNLDITKEIYKMIQTKYEQTKIAEAGELGGTRIISHASVSSSPIKPNKSRSILLAAVLGLTIGVGLAFIKEYLDISIRRPADVESIGFSNLGAVLYIDHARELSSIEEIRQTLTTNFSQKSAVMDSYASLEANLRFLELDEPIKSTLITSSVAKEGKTTTAINLGLTMAQMGKEVLVIDADFRNPAIGKVFGSGDKGGLTGVALEDLSLGQAVLKPYCGDGIPVGRELQEMVGEKELLTETEFNRAKSQASEDLGEYLIEEGYLTQEQIEEIRAEQCEDLEGFSLLPVDKIPPNPAAFFNSDRWKEILRETEKNFDAVLIDSPPVNVAPDTAIISSDVDGTMVVVAVDETDIGALEQAKNQLDKSGTLVVGAVLNKLRKSRSRYYGYGYGGGVWVWGRGGIAQSNTS